LYRSMIAFPSTICGGVKILVDYRTGWVYYLIHG
jgi:hypothetical protein